MRFFISLALSIASLITHAQQSIVYRLNMDNIHHHELRINVQFQDLKKDSLTIVMPNASPGRYATHNFAKNVYEEQAFDQNDQEVPVKRLDPFSWRVPVRNGYVAFEYTLFGNHADGTYAGIDSRKLHLNMPASFVYGKNLKKTPVNLIIDLEGKPEWSVATQLERVNDSTFRAPDYYYFYDSPTLVGAIDWRSWKEGDQTIEVAMMHTGTEAELDDYTNWIKKIVKEEKAVFGSLPEFDFDRYTFLITYNPWSAGDGMEHRNSTICSSSYALDQYAKRLISTVAHEFFHAWNIERIRPKSLEPFDFTKMNMSGALWFGEGFTSYYDDLTLARTGIISPEDYVQGLTRTLNYVMNFPGRTIRNPIEMSQNAPYVDAATSVDLDNFKNNFISYYSYGSVLGLGLDLLIREKFESLTLDDYMQYLWTTYGKPEKPYTIDQLQEALSTVTNDPVFAENYFDQYIYNSQLPDYQSLFENVGIQMTRVNPDASDLLSVRLDEERIISSPVLKNTTLYRAGLEQGDQILSINGQEISSPEDFGNIVKHVKPGEKVLVNFVQLGERKTTQAIAVADQMVKLTYLPDEQLNQKTIGKRANWLKLNSSITN